MLRAAYIAQWNHNQKTLQACVVKGLEQIDIQHYLQWYKNITQTHIQRPQFHHEQRYGPRAWYNQMTPINLVSILWFYQMNFFNFMIYTDYMYQVTLKFCIIALNAA